MVQLKDSVNEAVLKLNDLLEITEQTKGSLDDSQQQITDFSQQLEEDWLMLNERVQTFQENVRNSQSELVELRQQVQEGFTQLYSKIETSQTELNQVLKETDLALTNLDQEIDSLSLDLDQSFTQVDESFLSLKENSQTKEVELEESINQTDDYLLNNFKPELETHQGDIEQTNDNLVDYINQAIPQLNEKIIDFTSAIDSLVEQITNKLEDVNNNTEESAQQSLNFLTQFHNDGISNLLERVNELKDLMSNLSSFIDTTTDGVITTKNVMNNATTTVNSGLQIALGILEDLRDIFG